MLYIFPVLLLYVYVVEIAIGCAGEGNSEAILETLLTHAVSIKLFPLLLNCINIDEGCDLIVLGALQDPCSFIFLNLSLQHFLRSPCIIC